MSTTVSDAAVAVEAIGRGDTPGSLPDLLRDYEKRLIVHALAASKGSQRRAARALGVLPTTLSMKMKRLGLRGPGNDTEPLLSRPLPARGTFADR